MTAELEKRGPVGTPEELLVEPQEGESLYEEARLIILRELAKTGRTESGVNGAATLAQRPMIFEEGEINPETVSYDSQFVPGIWQPMRPEGNQAVLAPLTLPNHLLMANKDPRAARGLIRRIPALNKLLLESGLSEEEALPALASAGLAALCSAETLAGWDELANDKAALAALGCGLILVSPVLLYQAVEEKIRKLSKNAR